MRLMNFVDFFNFVLGEYFIGFYFVGVGER